MTVQTIQDVQGYYEVLASPASTGHPIGEFYLSAGHCTHRWGPNVPQKNALRGISSGSGSLQQNVLTLSLNRTFGLGPAAETVVIQLGDVDLAGLTAGQQVDVKIDYTADGVRLGLSKLAIRKLSGPVFNV
jgi:hypothetical protein